MDGTLAYAASQQVPIWPAGRWLAYTEARDATTIAGTTWNAGTGTLTFTVAVPDGAEAQTLMLPESAGGSVLANVTIDNETVPTTLIEVNGAPTRMFSVAPASGGGPRTVVAQYLDEDSLPTIAIGNTSIAEGDSASAPATLTVSLTGPAPVAVAVHYATGGGTATSGSDYTAASGTLVFPVGTTSLPLPITVLGDVGFEPAETITVTLSNPTGATIDDGSGVVTITNDDPEPILTDTTAEDFSAMCVVHTGTRAGASGDVRLLGTFRDDFAVATFDPRWVAGNYGPGVAPTPSAGLVRLADEFGASLRSAADLPVASMDVRASFTEGEFQSIGLADFSFTSDYARFSTEDGTSLWAMTSGDVPTNLGPIPSGFHDYTIERVVENFVDEIVRYRIDGAVVAEHPLLAGELPASLILWLANRGTDPSRALTIDRVETDPLFATTGGTFESCVVDALEVMAWKNLTWDALVPTGTSLAVSTRTSIATANPASPSGWSAWSAPLAASGAAITSPPGRYLQYRLTLATTNDAVSPIVGAVAAEAFGPAPPLLSIAPVTVAESAGTAAFTVSLSWPSSAPVGVSYATGAGTATSADFTPVSGPLAFAPGQVSQVVNVAVANDVLHEAAETFTVTLSAPSGATIATAQATGTITDDDPLPVAVADAYATPFGTALVVAAPGVLINDSNTHGGTMSATLVTGVAHGTLVLGANGSVNYTPANGYVGADSFVYQVADGSGTGNSVTVSITVGDGSAADC